MEPWGLSGPDFIGWYVGALIGIWGIGYVWYGVALQSGKQRTQLGPPPTTHHLAYLANGADRVIETGVAALLAKDRLRVDSGGR